MKGILIATALGLGLLGANVPTAAPARASETGDYRYSKSESTYQNFGVLLLGTPNHRYRNNYRRDRHDFRPSHRRAFRHSHRKHRTYKKQRRAYRQGRMDYQAVRPCRATSKIGFDGYGRRARIGGTMCYDAYGRPYIVRGSRFIIQIF
jgi:hypothetical protein